ncbi:MAG: type II toxin-antitoxin system RelE/ParE family toxin [bacterium]
MTPESPLRVVFYRTDYGNEPVREWLKALPQEERKIIGEDIKTVQFCWPLGMPLVRKMAPHLWEVRSRLRNRIARILFTVHGSTIIVLLHGFMKKTQRTPDEDLDLARRRMRDVSEVPHEE